MCSNYEPIVAFPTGLAPCVRLSELAKRESRNGCFRLLPQWTKGPSYGGKTCNARTDAVATLSGYRAAWRTGQRCIIPAETIFEPGYETGKAVRWGIQQPGQVPMGIAGIYESWKNTLTGEPECSFSMLTGNADGHPVMSRFQAANEEKRLVVILDSKHYDEWPTCDVTKPAASSSSGGGRWTRSKRRCHRVRTARPPRWRSRRPTTFRTAATTSRSCSSAPERLKPRGPAT